MPILRRRVGEILLRALLLYCTCTVQAEEGGSGHYFPGSMASFMDGVSPNTALIFQLNVIDYEGSFNTGVPAPIAQHLPLWGGYDFADSDIMGRNLAKVGYAKGVPMGGDLKPAPAGKTPNFMVWAIRDPEGANLDRIQIIKGWADQKGVTHEHVCDVAWSGSRKPDKDGKLPPVGDTVDLSVPTWSNTIGAAELVTTWQDPQFNPQQHAFYYVRVIDIPTPRWTAYDRIRLKVDMPFELCCCRNRRL